MKFPVATGDPGPPDAGPLTTPPVMVPMDVSTTESKSSKTTAPGTEVTLVPGLLVIVRAIAGLTASTYPPTTNAALSFDFIVKPLSTKHRSRHQHRSHRVPSSRVHFLDNARRSDLCAKRPAEIFHAGIFSPAPG